jgi:hypothetical protein
METLDSVVIRKVGFQENLNYKVVSQTETGYVVKNDTDEDTEVLSDEVVQKNYIEDIPV